MLRWNTKLTLLVYGCSTNRPTTLLSSTSRLRSEYGGFYLVYQTQAVSNERRSNMFAQPVEIGGRGRLLVRNSVIAHLFQKHVQRDDFLRPKSSTWTLQMRLCALRSKIFIFAILVMYGWHWVSSVVERLSYLLQFVFGVVQPLDCPLWGAPWSTFPMNRGQGANTREKKDDESSINDYAWCSHARHIQNDRQCAWWLGEYKEMCVNVNEDNYVARQ